MNSMGFMYYERTEVRRPPPKKEEPEGIIVMIISGIMFLLMLRGCAAMVEDGRRSSYSPVPNSSIQENQHV